MLVEDYWLHVLMHSTFLVCLFREHSLCKENSASEEGGLRFYDVDTKFVGEKRGE